MSFNKPTTTFIASSAFGIPAGTTGRGTQIVRAIVLHDLDTTMEGYDAQIAENLQRSQPHPEHISLHYALDYAGNVHQYVLDSNLAWGIDDYDFGHYPSAHPAGNPLWSMLATYPDDPPDSFVIHVGTTSGANPQAALLPYPLLNRLVHLLAYLCVTYGITADADHIVTHNMIDGQYFERCVEEDYPLAAIISAVAAFIAAGGDPPVYNGNPYPLGDGWFQPLAPNQTVDSQYFVTTDDFIIDHVAAFCAETGCEYKVYARGNVTPDLTLTHNANGTWTVVRNDDAGAQISTWTSGAGDTLARAFTGADQLIVLSGTVYYSSLTIGANQLNKFAVGVGGHT